MVAASARVLVIGLVVIAALFGVSWLAVPPTPGRRGRGTRQHRPPADELAALPTAELDRRSASALVAIDDAVKASDEELGFAQAQFGPDATGEFETVLADAKAQVTEAFRLRQTLDDNVPDTEPQVRETATRILRTCAAVSAMLDAQKAGFDHLRDLEAHVEQALESHARSAAALRAAARPGTRHGRARWPRPTRR